MGAIPNHPAVDAGDLGPNGGPAGRADDLMTGDHGVREGGIEALDQRHHSFAAGRLAPRQRDVLPIGRQRLVQ